MNNLFKFFVVVFLSAIFSCKKDNKTNTPEPAPIDAGKGVVKIEFENLVDTLPLIFNKNYINAKGDTFQLTKFNYFISNIIITDNNNVTYTEPESYHCVKHSLQSSTTISLTNVPPGSYKSISFILGVDSARNVSGAQTGGLDPGAQASDMYWTWSTGYIFFKLEGTSPKSTELNKLIQYHIGGFGGINKAQRNFNFTFSSTTANVSSTATPTIHLTANANEVFKTPNLIDFTTQNIQASTGAGAKIYADNYADMIKFKHVHN